MTTQPNASDVEELNEERAKEIIRACSTPGAILKVKNPHADITRLIERAEAYLQGISDQSKRYEKLVEQLDISNAAVRTALNYRLTREEKRSDWKEHLERFDLNVAKWKASTDVDSSEGKG